jgi:hypothetical protein
MRVLALSMAVPLGALGPQVSRAEVRSVDADGTGDYPTIAAAILASSHGDVVELGDGVYTGDGNRDLTNNETEVTIRSRSGDPSGCVIDLEGSAAAHHHFITLVITGEKQGSGYGVHDVTITGGYAEAGGAIAVADWSNAEIFGCVFRENHATIAGGAIYGAVGLPQISDCHFEANSAPRGGAIGGLVECLWTCEGCTFVANTADEGGAVYSGYDLGSVFTNCTLVANSADAGSGFALSGPSATTIENTIVAFGAGGAAIQLPGTAVPVLTCCDLFGNEGGDWTGAIADQLDLAGNITADPQFCDLEAGDFTVHDSSPCAPATPPNPECGLIGAWPVGCGPIGVRSLSWSEVKARYSR